MCAVMCRSWLTRSEHYTFHSPKFNASTVRIQNPRTPTRQESDPYSRLCLGRCFTPIKPFSVIRENTSRVNGVAAWIYVDCQPCLYEARMSSYLRLVVHTVQMLGTASHPISARSSSDTASVSHCSCWTVISYIATSALLPLHSLPPISIDHLRAL